LHCPSVIEPKAAGTVNRGLLEIDDATKVQFDCTCCRPALANQINRYLVVFPDAARMPGERRHVRRRRNMKTIFLMAVAATVAFSAVSFAATPEAAKRGPITSQGHYCLSYEAGTDCSFTSYAQCEATASGIGGSCMHQDDRAGDHPAHR
jgi:hypothetical protein